MNIANEKSAIIIVGRKLPIIAFFILLILLPARASAFILKVSDLSYGYGTCSWTENGNGTSTVRVAVRYKEGSGKHLGGKEFVSRGLLLYTYDKNGIPKPNNAIAKSATLNGVPSAKESFTGDGYTMYMQHHSSGTIWSNDKEFVADFEVVIDNSLVSDWPAFGLRAGNFTTGDDVAEITGAAYISRFGNETHGTCKLIDPTNPPLPIVAINLTAPDWNLGELRRGDNKKTFWNSADQLCFTYTGAAVSGKKFVINASNENGVVNGRYLLRHLKNTSKTVPYNLTLDAGNLTLSLPNASNATVSFSTSGKTCFVPVFTSTVDNLTESGDYSDVLKFTVVTKP